MTKQSRDEWEGGIGRVSSLPEASRRSVTVGKNGMVATSEPLAAMVGRDILRAGGNAVDAAIACAAALTVTEPTGCAIGGDAFALIWRADATDPSRGELFAINGSGGAPAALSLSALAARGVGGTMPRYGIVPITVPGVVATWHAVAKRFGRLPFQQLLAGAVDLARHGYAVPPVIARQWGEYTRLYRDNLSAAEFAEWAAEFTLHGRSPRPGDVYLNSGLADTLQDIAETEGATLYEGRLAHALSRFMEERGGFLGYSDLAAYEPEWVDPIHVDYGGYSIWELPPNGQGIVALLALKLLERQKSRQITGALQLHVQIEAIKAALDVGYHQIADPRFMDRPYAELLSDEQVSKLARQMTSKASVPSRSQPHDSGTVYLCTADQDGNMVSFIQSAYKGFGSGIVLPGTGIALQNRGWDFSLDERDANCLAPGKRPYHTIIPGFITRGSSAVGPFGLMGGSMQPQGHVQLLLNMIDKGMTIQSAIDAPRWQWTGGAGLLVEKSFDTQLVNRLLDLGHEITLTTDVTRFGRAQVITRNEQTGVLHGGTESRADGAVVPV